MSSPTLTFRVEQKLLIKRVAIITKRDDLGSETFARELRQWLTSRSIDTIKSNIGPNIDLIIVLGGDGTLLHIAEQAARYAIPVLGINLGNLGFLTELKKNEAIPALEALLNDKVLIENRMMLKATYKSKGKTSISSYALNDVVIAKNASDRLLMLSTSADKEPITTYRADGLIFSSPTGSTAYNLSAGGPIVYPGLATITVTPICPFMLGSRPVILPAEKRVTTRFGASADASDRGQVIVDGRPLWEMEKGDELEIYTAKQPLQLVVSSARDYFTILRNKLHWGVSSSGSS